MERLVWGGWVSVVKGRLVGNSWRGRVWGKHGVSVGGGGGGGAGAVCPWAMVCVGSRRVLMAVPIMPVGGAVLHLACPG